MKITIEINNNEDVTEAIQYLKLLVTEQAPKVTTPKKATVKKQTP